MSDIYKNMSPSRLSMDVMQGLSAMLGIDKGAIPSATQQLIRESCQELCTKGMRDSALRKFLDGDLTDGRRPFHGFVGDHMPQCRAVLAACDFLAALLARKWDPARQKKKAAKVASSEPAETDLPT